MDEIIFQIPTDDECDYIDDMLIAHNQESVPFTQEEPYQPIRRCIKNAEGQVIAGLLAYSVCWRILYIDVLWVNKEHRGKGYGRALLQEVERVAREMGCHVVHLDSFDFQGKDFYVKCGYQVFGELKDSPKGHSEYFLCKYL